MSLSMASCLPGIPSRAKRAPTSAMRAAPRVITTKLTISSTPNTTRPKNTLPDMTNIAKPSITPPAAPVPVWPWPMISFVEETFRDSRNIKEARSTVGNTENSNGRSMNKVTVNIRMASPNEAASPMSKTHAGMGKIIMTMIAISASANKIVGWNSSFTGGSSPAGQSQGTGFRRAARPIVVQSRTGDSEIGI